MTRTLIIFSIGLLILTNLYTLKQRNELKKENNAFREDLSDKKELLIVTHQRALKYQIIAFKIDSICDLYKSSREAKQRNKELLKLSEL